MKIILYIRSVFLYAVSVLMFTTSTLPELTLWIETTRASCSTMQTLHKEYITTEEIDKKRKNAINARQYVKI